MIDDRNQFFSFLQTLGVTFENEVNSKGWAPILCYAHHDKNLGNAFINTETGVTNCFSCGASYSLFSLVKFFHPNISFDEFLLLIGYSEDYIEEKTSNRNYNKQNTNKLEKINKDIFTFDFSNLQTARFNPNDYDYTKLRGFTREFISNFKIRLITSGYYKNYIGIPIIDPDNSVKTIEFRKVGDNYKEAKVLYPKNISVKKTIFNKSNLDLNEILYIKEGVSGIPKIWSNISKNVTAIFGVSKSEDQIDIISKFQDKKIFIPDNDDASTEMILEYSKRIRNFYVANISCDDKEDNFLDELKNCEIIPGIDYVLNYYNLMNWRVE